MLDKEVEPLIDVLDVSDFDTDGVKLVLADTDVLDVSDSEIDDDCDSDGDLLMDAESDVEGVTETGETEEVGVREPATGTAGDGEPVHVANKHK